MVDSNTKSLLKEEIIHVDESWIRVDWELDWIHVTSTKYLTLLKLHEKRWREAIEDNAILPNFNKIIISDNYLSYKNKYNFQRYYQPKNPNFWKVRIFLHFRQ